MSVASWHWSYRSWLPISFRFSSVPLKVKTSQFYACNSAPQKKKEWKEEEEDEEEDKEEEAKKIASKKTKSLLIRLES